MQGTNSRKKQNEHSKLHSAIKKYDYVWGMRGPEFTKKEKKEIESIVTPLKYKEMKQDNER